MKSSSYSELRSFTARVVKAGDLLWRAGAERRAAWLGRAFSELANEQGALFAAALEQLPASTGLSREMVRWAVRSALTPLTGEALLAIDRAASAPNERALRSRPGQLCVVLLAGNVFTAAARAVAMPLLFGMPVLAKAASHDAAFVRLLHAALVAADAELAEAFQTVSFASHDDEQLSVLFEQADTVSVYGSDNTLNAIRARLGATVSFIGHGHGLGAAFVDALALRDEGAARIAAQALALDVAAYDQRGCMSPLVAWVRSAQPVAPEHFAALLHEALGQLAGELPRGALPIDVASAQLSFRGVAAMRGLLLEGERHAVAYEADGPLRLSPGYRNLQLLSVPNSEALCDRLQPLGIHLKCLGVTGLTLEDRDWLMHNLPARLSPRVCALGSMQLPPTDSVHDGVAAWEGLVRYAQRDI